jgi:hypothetical protein
MIPGTSAVRIQGGGGAIVASGTSEQGAETAESYTGRYLRPYLTRSGQRKLKSGAGSFGK